jgi:hypothetical protein
VQQQMVKWQIRLLLDLCGNKDHILHQVKHCEKKRSLVKMLGLLYL